MTRLLTSKQVCDLYGIDEKTLDNWHADGCPIARKSSGRRPAMHSPAKVARWVSQKGKNPRGPEGAMLRAAESEAPAQPEQRRAVDPPAQLEMVRAQYKNLMGRFAMVARSGGSDKDIASLARALTGKGYELRLLEMSVLEWQRQTGALVSFDEVRRQFVELASGTRERVMALPNLLAPTLRPYLRDPDEAGAVRDAIDAAVRQALTALPETLPEKGTP